MKARHLAVALTLTPVLALGGQAALAQGRHQGGGGRSGGSHRVSAGTHRGSAGAWRTPSHGHGRVAGAQVYSSRGSVAQRRHPRAGTGTGGYGYSDPHHGGHYGHRGHYYGGGYYRPYYGGYYWPYYGGYYGSSLYASLYFGWPSYSYSAWPYDSGGYSMGYDNAPYAPDYAPRYGYPADPAGTPTPDIDRSYDTDRDSGRLRVEVRPENASVYVDDQFRGTAREARLLTLPAGRHVVELVRPGFATERREVEVVRGVTRDVLVEMQRP